MHDFGGGFEVLSLYKLHLFNRKHIGSHQNRPNRVQADMKRNAMKICAQGALEEQHL